VDIAHRYTETKKKYMRIKIFQQTLYTAIHCRHIFSKGNSVKNVEF